MSKERPILFNGAMVRAILSGEKTQTRRVLKQATGPSLSVDMVEDAAGVAELSWLQGDGPGYEVEETTNRVRCPFGQPGDRLWVRESFWGCDMPGYGDQPCVVYDNEWSGKEYLPAEARPWARKFGRIPAIHMPRAACRLVLEITAVRVERLQAISEVDAIAEGIERNTDEGVTYCGRYGAGDARPSYAFRDLWTSTGGDWDSNPWVWVIEFKVVAG